MISLILPVTSTNQNYTDNIINNIRELYPDKNDVEIVVEVGDNINLASNYNNAVAKAKGEKIILLHNDMIIKPGFIETMDKHITKGRVTTYTRVEPPIFTDTYPGKILLDCGSDLKSFNSAQFNQFSIQEGLIDGGSQLFFGCLKEDYIKLDDKTFNPPQMWCSDDDLHLRYKLAGFEHKVSSAHVYHFVSKTSRRGNYQQVEECSNRNYIRKWGSRSSTKKYDIGFVIEGCNYEILSALEPWCSTIYLQDEMQVLTTHYLDAEQKNTKFNLSKRIKDIKHTIPNNDVVVKFDGKQLTNQSFQLLIQLPDIIAESGEVGDFELGIFKVSIYSTERYEQKLITNDNPYYINQLL